MNSSPRVKSFLFLCVVAAVAVIACLSTERWRHRSRQPNDMHLWIHHQLEITSEQEVALAETEQRYASKRRDLAERIRTGNRELAQAMLESKEPSPRVKSAIDTIHEAQAQLQQVTIDHVFEMRVILRPDQYDKLLNLTANALYDTKH